MSKMTKAEKKEYIEYLFKCRDRVKTEREKLFSELVGLEVGIRGALDLRYFVEKTGINDYKVEIDNYLEMEND